MVVVPTPPLAPATATSWPPSTPAAASSPATRSRSARDHIAPARTLASSCSSESGSDSTSRTPACIAARSSSGESSAAISTTPTSGKRGRQLARQLDRRDAAQLVVQHDDVEVQPPQRARQVLRVGDAVDDLELLALGGQRRRAGGQRVVADREEEAEAHGLRVKVRCFLVSSDRSPGRSSARRTSEANDSACVTARSCSGVSANVTGTTGLRLRVLLLHLAVALGTVTPTSMTRAPGHHDLGLGGRGLGRPSRSR